MSKLSNCWQQQVGKVTETQMMAKNGSFFSP